VLVGAVHSSARVSKLTCNFRVNEKTLFTVSTFGKELALVFWMNIFTYLIWLVALRPVFATHLYFFCARFFVFSLIRYCLRVLSWFGRLYRAKSLQTLSFKLVSLLGCQFLLEKRLTHRVMYLVLNQMIVLRVLLPHITHSFAKHHFVRVILVLNKARFIPLLSRPRKGTFVVGYGGFSLTNVIWINRTSLINRYTRDISTLICKLACLVVLLLVKWHSARVTK